MNPTYYTSVPLYSKMTDLNNRFVVLESVLNTLHVDMARMNKSLSALEYAFHNSQQMRQPVSQQMRQPVLQQLRQPVSQQMQMLQQQQQQQHGYESSIPLRLFSPDVTPTLPPLLKKQNRYKADESNLAKYLEKDEEVNFSLSDNEEKSYVLKAVFNGAQLQVTECESVPTLLSFKTNKPGSILHRFVSELRKNGLSVCGPVGSSWNYCNVVREGSTLTLMQLSKK